MTWHTHLLCLAFASVPLRAMAAPTWGDVYEHLRGFALKSSPDIALASSAVEQARARHWGAWSRWLPNAKIQLSQTYSKDYSFLSSGVLPGGLVLPNPSQVRLARWEIQLSLPIYERSVHLGIQQSNSEWDLRKERLLEKKSELEWKLRERLGNYLLDSYQLTTLVNSLRVAENNLREIQVRFRLGQKTKIDLLRAQANVASLQSRQLSTSQKREATRASLLEFTGATQAQVAATGIYTLLQDEIKILHVIDEFTRVDSLQNRLQPYINSQGDKLIREKATSSSATYQTLTKEKSLAEIQASSVVAPFWPKLNFQARLNQQSPNWGEVFRAGQASHYFGVFLSVPVSLGGGNFAAYNERNHALDEANLRWHHSSRKFLNGVINQRLQLKALQKTVSSLKLTLDQREEILRLSQKSHSLGQLTLTELLTSQNELIESKANYAKAKIELTVLMHQFASHLGVSP